MPDYSFSLKTTYTVWSRARNRKFTSVFAKQMLRSSSYCDSLNGNWSVIFPHLVFEISPPHPKHVTAWKSSVWLQINPQKITMEFVVGAGKQDRLFTVKSGYSCLLEAEALECFCTSVTLPGRWKFWLYLVLQDVNTASCQLYCSHLHLKVVFPRIPETMYLSSPCSPPLMPVFSIGHVVSQICLDTPCSLI